MIFKKLKEMLIAFRDALRDTEETENIDWSSTIGVAVAVLITMAILVMFIEPLAMILKYIIYGVLFLIVLAPPTLLLRGAYHQNKQSENYVEYPVYFGYNGTCWVISKLSEAFREMEGYFLVFYLENIHYPRDNIITYRFRFVPRKEIQGSYELVQILQRIGEKMVARSCQQWGISANYYESLVACNIQETESCLSITFARNSFGIPYIVALRNAAYRDYHLASQVPADMEEKTEDDD
ncbi:hypothetical protein NE634_15960 [Lacrimispora saccharolytica]|nr:hypothetical protein [Lacrimispora saccharolytica]